MLPSSQGSSTMPRRGSLMRRCERVCCGILTYFPLVLVHGLTTWAVWVEVQLALLPETPFGESHVRSIVDLTLDFRNSLHHPRTRVLRSPQLVVRDRRLHRPGQPRHL